MLDGQERQRPLLRFRFEQSNAALDLRLDNWMIAHGIADGARLALGGYLPRQLVWDARERSAQSSLRKNATSICDFNRQHAGGCNFSAKFSPAKSLRNCALRRGRVYGATQRKRLVYTRSHLRGANAPKSLIWREFGANSLWHSNCESMSESRAVLTGSAHIGHA